MPFIVLEGLDGSGKSTQLKFLTALLAQSGHGCNFLHFPRFDSPVYGQLIARFLRGEFGSAEQVDPYIVALLFAGDRADASPRIRQWLAAGDFVVTDRYVYSNIAFQCAKIEGRQEQLKLKKWILDTEFGYNNLPGPDISLFLDVPFAFTEQRLTASREGSDRDYLEGGQDIHENSLELQKKVREIYLECASEDPRLNIIDCSDGCGNIDTPGNNFDKITAVLKPILDSHGL